MNQQPVQKIEQLQAWFKGFTVLAVIGVFLSVVFGAAPGALTIIAIIFAILIKLQITKLRQTGEEKITDAKSNKRALIILGVFMGLFVVASVVATLYTS